MRRHLLPALLAALLAAVLLPAGASAQSPWRAIPSGTTQDIVAIDYQSPTRFWFATAGGQIGYRKPDGTFGFGTGIPGVVVFNDIAFDPSGTTGIAVGNTNNVWRSTDAGVTWTKLTTVRTNDNTACANVAGSLVPPGNLYTVGWGSGGVVYLGDDNRTVLRSQDFGATYAEINKTSTGCRLKESSAPTGISDLQVISSGSGRASELVYFQGRDAFGPFFVTGDGLTTNGLFRPGGPNGTQEDTNFVADPTNPNRVWSTNICGFSCFVRSTDGMSSDQCICSLVNGEGSSQTAHRAIGFAGGTVVAVGDTGMIEASPDGIDFYRVDAPAPNATTAWLATDLYDKDHAAVGGAGGALVLNDTAATVPDIVAPTATITAPTTVVAGQPATFTANAADNAGGSGINPASFAWTALGTPGGSGNPVTITFPAAGTYTVRVTFADNAGNSATASTSVVVGTALPTFPPGTTTPGATKTTTVPGGSITLTAATTCVPVGKTFSARLSFKRSRKKGAKKVKVTRVDFFIDGKRVKIDRRAPFTQRLSVKSYAPGSLHTLKARATIKVRRGKSPTKSITAKFRVCSS